MWYTSGAGKYRIGCLTSEGCQMQWTYGKSASWMDKIRTGQFYNLFFYVDAEMH